MDDDKLLLLLDDRWDFSEVGLLLNPLIFYLLFYLYHNFLKRFFRSYLFVEDGKMVVDQHIVSKQYIRMPTYQQVCYVDHEALFKVQRNQEFQRNHLANHK